MRQSQDPYDLSLIQKAKIYLPLFYVFILILSIFSLIIIISTRLGIDFSHYSNYLEIIVIILVFSEMVLLVNSEHKMLQNMNIVDLSVATITKSVNLIHRDQIYNSLTETARDAKFYVKHISIAQSTTTENDDEKERERVEKFLKALRYSAEKKNVDIKVLGPEEPQAIGGLYERKSQGCTVRVNEAVNTFDTRIQVVDDKRIIIGLGQPLSSNPTSKPPKSESGFIVKSYILAEILNLEFDRLWKESKSKDLDIYIKEVLCSKIFVKPIIYSDSFMRDMNNRLNIRNITPELMDNLERQKCILALKNNKLKDNKSYKICCCDNIKKIFEGSSDSEIKDTDYIKSKFPNIVLSDEEANMISKCLQE